MEILRIENITKTFGGLVALKNVDITVENGEILGLIGPNGAGKTTLFNVITGFYPPTSGVVKYLGRIIVSPKKVLKPHEICKLGIARTFQIPKPFLKMSVLENVMVGALFGGKKSVSIQDARREALHWIKVCELFDKKDVLAMDLNLNEKRRLELARALATEPKIVLIDEVISGLNPTETDETVKLICKVKTEYGLTIIWIEHVMRAIMRAASRIVVLSFGEKLAEGRPEEIATNKKVIDEYLGTKNYEV